MTMTPELQSKIANWRARCAGQGDPMTVEEYILALRELRQGRVQAQEASAASKSRAKKPAVLPDADSMLDELS